MPLVTLTRQLGSYGDQIAQEVAEALGVSYVDRNLVKTVAEQMEAPEQLIQDIEEKTPTFPKRVANAIIQAFADGASLAPLVGVAPTPMIPPPDEPAPDSSVFTLDVNDTLYLNFVRQVIRQIAETGNGVVVGRAGHLLLKDVPHALHVHVVAPMDIRIRRLMHEQNCTKEAAEKMASNSDHGRESYTQRFYHARWSDPTLYHLTINTGMVSRQKAVEMIVAAAGMV